MAMATHSSTLAWKIPWMEEPGRLQSMGLLGVRHNWVTSLSLFTLIFQGEWVQHCLLYQVHLFSLRKRISWYKTSREKSDPLSNSFLRIKDNFSSSSWFYTLPSSAVAAAKSLQSCPTLCDPIDGSPPGAPFPGILQARILEWVAISFCSAWKWKWSRSIMSDS